MTFKFSNPVTHGVVFASLGIASLSMMPLANAQAIDSPEVQVVAQAQGKTLAEIAGSSDSFKTLTALLQHLDVVGALNNPNGEAYTVFAPTDEAFAALPAGTIESLKQPENRDTLFDILAYHVIPGSVTSDQLSSGKVKSANGLPLKVKLKKSGVKVNQSKVEQADIVASNGVIHVIDKVLIPKR